MPEQRYEGYTPNRNEQPRSDDPDVLLDVPVLKVDEIDLEVEDLKAHVSLRAELADLVKVNVGVDVFLGKVHLGIKGLEAQALLKVKLDNILNTLDRALEAIEKSPQILGGTVREISQAAQDVGQTTQLTEGTTRQGGGTTERADQRAGSPLDETVDEEATDNLADLQIEEEYVDDQGRIVGRARDASGNVVEETLDEEGNVQGPNAPEEEDLEAGDGDTSEVRATDAARRKAWEFGVRLSNVEGTGSGGRILVKDVEKAAK